MVGGIQTWRREADTRVRRSAMHRGEGTRRVVPLAAMCRDLSAMHVRGCKESRSQLGRYARLMRTAAANTAVAPTPSPHPVSGFDLAFSTRSSPLPAQRVPHGCGSMQGAVSGVPLKFLLHVQGILLFSSGTARPLHPPKHTRGGGGGGGILQLCPPRHRYPLAAQHRSPVTVPGCGVAQITLQERRDGAMRAKQPLPHEWLRRHAAAGGM